MAMRTYGDSCGIAHGLDVVGERWALLVVRELLLGPMRFRDLRTALPGTSPNVLSQRLRELSDAGVVGQRRLDPPSGVQVYELTEHGAGLEPILIALGDWALRAPGLDPAGSLSAVSAMLTLRTYFAPAEPWHADYEIRLGEQRYTAAVEGRRLSVRQGAAAAPVAAVETDPKTFLALITGRRATKEVAVRGDRPLLDRLVKAVVVPQ
jgi:DNA-binding HxlR family transcriptional regulator